MSFKIKYNIDTLEIESYYNSRFEQDYLNSEDYRNMITDNNFIEVDNILINGKLIKQNNTIIYTSEIANNDVVLLERKSALISSRQFTLNQNKDTFIKMFRDFLLSISTSENPAEEIINIANQNKVFCENDKALEEEIAEINLATSLEQLSKFE
jgi:hypothetical protein